ncbi:MAG: sensor domain-containing protein, partial [Promicromonosporaceae bacterium]|nr:sensor domain-containing protein [Promicromonosporaceae bacterium]
MDTLVDLDPNLYSPTEPSAAEAMDPTLPLAVNPLPSSTTTFAPATAPYYPASRTRLFPWVGQIWREFGYLTLQFLLAPFAFTYAVLTGSLLAGLAVTVVGLFAVGGLVLGARGWGGMYRRMDASLLGNDIAPPPAFVKPRGFWRGLGAMLFDGTGWRVLLYMFISLPLAILSWTISLVFLTVGIGGLTHWAWSWALPAQTMYDGTVIRGFVIVNA